MPDRSLGRLPILTELLYQISAGWPGYETTTDSEGHYIIGELSGGSYVTVAFSDPSRKYSVQYYNGKSNYDAADYIEIIGGQETTGLMPSWNLEDGLRERLPAAMAVLSPTPG